MGCKKSKHAVAAGNTITITKPSNGDRLNDKVKEVFHPPVLASDINARSSVQQKERANVAACKNNGFVDETTKRGGENGLCKENKGCLAPHVNEKENVNKNGFVLEGREKDVDKEEEERCLDEQVKENERVNVGLDKNSGYIEVAKVESKTKLTNEGDDVKKEGCLVKQVNEKESEIETLVKDDELEDISETETEKGGEEENVDILEEGCRVEQVREEESKSETLLPTKYEYEIEEAEKGEENNVDVEYEECLVEQVNENESKIETLSPTKDEETELKPETDVDIEKEEGLDENESESETLSSIKDEEENDTSETEMVKEGNENDVDVEEEGEEAKENESENETLSSPTMEVVEEST